MIKTDEHCVEWYIHTDSREYPISRLGLYKVAIVYTEEGYKVIDAETGEEFHPHAIK